MFFRLLLLLCGGLTAFAVHASDLEGAPLLLTGARERIEVWPAVTMLADPGKQMALADVLAAAPQFARPTTAYATLGLRKEAVWLRAPLQVAPEAGGEWILDLEYAVLNRVDLHLLHEGRPVRQARLGNLQPFSERPLASRSHAVALQLEGGAAYELVMRVETLGGMILPITLNRPSAFIGHALGEQMLQGLLTGLGLCLLLYSLAQWVSLREPLFIKYAILIGGGLVFSITQFGLGRQHLWPDNLWLELHLAGLAALVAATGTALFVDQVLAGPQTSRRFGLVMKGVAALLMATAVAYALDWIHVHQVSAVIGTLGLAPALLGMPGTIALARRGEAVGWTFLAAWTGYFFSTAVMVGLIKGQVPVNFWTLHSFQFGATLDMLLFMRVIALRNQAVHAAARQARQERETLLSMAHTDVLTGLPNRRGFDAALAAALPQSTPQRLLAVYMLDLDGFKQVNDRHGHEVGDELLAAVAQRLRRHLRASDVVARIGGDEFVAMTAGLPSDREAQAVGQQLVDAFRAPFQLGERECRVGLTIGYVLVPIDGDDPVALLRQADAAMYAGKQAGKSCLRRGDRAPAHAGA
jgi:diguanylate cyclase (GGDEF)-like protein